MGWAVGFDPSWGRDIGYGVPATCDQPGCGERIDRGLGYVCGGEPYGGEKGCGSAGNVGCGCIHAAPVPVPLPIQQEAACRWAHGEQTDLDSRGLCRICAEDEEDDE